MHPPEQVCRKCRGALAIRADTRTGAAVRAGGRALMQCVECGEMQVAPDPMFEARRHRIARLVGWLGAACYVVGMTIYNYGALIRQSVSHTTFVYLLLLMMSTVMFALACRSLVGVILPGNARERFEYAVVCVFFLAAFCLTVFFFVEAPRSLRSVPAVPATSPAPSVPQSSISPSK